MDLRKMTDAYYEDGLTRELAEARVCQDIILKAIAISPFSENVTIKGGVVMRSLTNNNRRATRDIDLDFIHYSLDDVSIRAFVNKLNCIPGIQLEIIGQIEELKHQDYHGKSIKIRITDDSGVSINSKMDIGVHKKLEMEQEEYCFDVCMDETMRENTMGDIVRRIESTFQDNRFLQRVSNSRQRWLDEDINNIANGIIDYFRQL